MLMRAAELFSEGMTVREVATLLRIAKVRQEACEFEHGRMDFCLLLVMPILIITSTRSND
jgi:hypothetical protein